MKKTMSALFLGSLLVSQVTVAETDSSFGVGVVGGTVGAGVYVGYKLNDYVSFRVQGTKWNITDRQIIDDIDYDIDVDIGAVGGYVDLYPFGGVFRVSAGFSRSLFSANVANASTELVQIGDAPPVPVRPGDISGQMEFDTAPYIGIGWGSVAPKGLGFRFDLGAHLLGKPDIQFDVQGTARTALIALGRDPDAEAAKEAQKAQDEIGDVVYPEISIAITYGW